MVPLIPQRFTIREEKFLDLEIRNEALSDSYAGLLRRDEKIGRQWILDALLHSIGKKACGSARCAFLKAKRAKIAWKHIFDAVMPLTCQIMLGQEVHKRAVSHIVYQLIDEHNLTKL